jgi:hypothetical protein
MTRIRKIEEDPAVGGNTLSERHPEPPVSISLLTRRKMFSQCIASEAHKELPEVVDDGVPHWLRCLPAAREQDAGLPSSLFTNTMEIGWMDCQFITFHANKYFYSTEDEVHEGFEYETRGRTQHVAEFGLELAVGERDSNGKHVIGDRGDVGSRSHHSLICCSGAVVVPIKSRGQARNQVIVEQRHVTPIAQHQKASHRW